MTIYPTEALRTVILHAQGLHSSNQNDPVPSPNSLYQIIDKIGCIQIDTLQVVRRSQYLVLWSRAGIFDPGFLDDLAFGTERRLFEGWQHAAALIPITEYRYQKPHQRNLREHPTSWYNRWLSEQVQKDFVPHVLERIRQEGALKVSDFESGDHKGGAWWDWRPAKVALEYLYAFGELMISDRRKFQRVYDLTSRVLPDWVDTQEPTVEERDRFWIERGARSMGVGSLRHAGDFTWMKVFRSKPITEELLKTGVLIPIRGQLPNGASTELIIHRDTLPTLQQAADGEIKAERTTFLSPFDNLWWATRRDEMLWCFHQSLEAYLPAPKRKYGYFCLPILHKDRLVGRFDPKLDRKSGKLILHGLYLEPGVKPSSELIKSIAQTMRNFMDFHGAKEVIVEHSEPATFGKKLMNSL